MSSGIVVVGAGVSGLSTALELRRRGLDVAVWAERFTPDTTSDRAAAFWYPYLCGPAESVARWGAESLEEYVRLATEHPESGCRLRPSEILFEHAVEPPAWAAAVAGFGSGPAAPPYAHAYRLRLPVLDTTRYMRWLHDRAVAAGVTMERRTVSSLDEPLAVTPVAVHCTGLGARTLAEDPAVVPVRGQVVTVRQPDVDTVYVDDEGPNALAYVIPRCDDVVLGGTSQRGDWRTSAGDAETAGILERCGAVCPALRGAEITGVSVGLRPARPDVRLEAERRGSGWIVHNYGHGGGGFTLAIGCARDAADLAVALAG